MKKYHVKSGDGNGYYGVGYESYRQAESLLKISQEHDPQAYIVEEGYHFTNADRIRAMSDEELRDFLQSRVWICETHKLCDGCPMYHEEKGCLSTLEWLKQPAEGD